MFWKKSKTEEVDLYHITTDNEILEMNKAVFIHINELNKEKLALEKEKLALEKELNAIKPILEDPRLEPAVSKTCDECRFAVYGDRYLVNDWNGGLNVTKQLLGCRKHGLCEDFKPRMKEE